jgi:hypothetical protein
MRIRQSLTVRSLALAAVMATMSILSLVSTVFADGGGTPYPR